MKVKFIKSYRGWITDEVFFKAGDVFEADSTQVKYLKEAGVIEAEKPKPRAKPKPKAAPKK